jgi:tetratricopeptide (TPR) repeat protein
LVAFTAGAAFGRAQRYALAASDDRLEWMSHPQQADDTITRFHSRTAPSIADVVVPDSPETQVSSAPSEAGLKAPRWRGPAVLVAIAAAAIVAYQNSFQGTFVFDDRTWIVDNLTIRQLWPPGPLFFPPSSVLTGGRPVLTLTLAINYALGGTEVWGYHAVNLAIHILAAWTLFGIVRLTLLLPRRRDRFTAVATPLALTIALIWAVHPLQSAAVTYIVQRNEALVGLFYLLTLYCVIRGATAVSSARNATEGVPYSHQPVQNESGAVPSVGNGLRAVPSRGAWYAAAVLACLLGMLTKEVMATAPLVVLLYDRTFLSGTFRKSLRQRWGLYAVLAATWAAVGWALLSTDFHSGTAGFGIKQFTAWSYLLTEPGVIVHYLQSAFWPAGLSLDYGWPAATTASEIVPAGIVVVALLALTCWAVVKHPAWGFLGAWFFMILAPTSSFIPIQDAAFDHRMYLPLAAVIALVVMTVYLVGQLLVAWRAPQSIGMRYWLGAMTLLAVATPVAALAWATIVRNEDFRSEAAIWLDACAKQPRNARALNNAGEALNKLGQADAAVEYYRRAIDADPTYIPPINNLACARLERGDIAGAVALYQDALAIEPDEPWVTINLAKALSRQGQQNQAVDRCRRALQIHPELAEGHFVMAGILLRQGHIDQAVAEYHAALRLKPGLPEAHAELANLLAGQGKLAEAIPHLQQAAEGNPHNSDLRERVAMALTTVGRDEEAAAELRKILETNPNHAAAHFHLGSVLARRGDWTAAFAEWRRANQLQPDSPAILSRLAMGLAACPDASLRNGTEALRLAEQAARLDRAPPSLDAEAAARAELGQFDKAAELAEQAMNIASRQNNETLAAKIADRLSLYLRRMPYRESPAGQARRE